MDVTTTTDPSLLHEVTVTIRTASPDVTDRVLNQINDMLQGDDSLLGRASVVSLSTRAFAVPDGIKLFKCGDDPWTWIAARSKEEATALFAEDSRSTVEAVADLVEEADLDTSFYVPPDSLDEYPEDAVMVQVRVTARELIAEVKEFPRVIMETGNA